MLTISVLTILYVHVYVLNICKIYIKNYKETNICDVYIFIQNIMYLK